MVLLMLGVLYHTTWSSDRQGSRVRVRVRVRVRARVKGKGQGIGPGSRV